MTGEISLSSIEMSMPELCGQYFVCIKVSKSYNISDYRCVSQMKLCEEEDLKWSLESTGTPEIRISLHPSGFVEASGLNVRIQNGANSRMSTRSALNAPEVLAFLVYVDEPRYWNYSDMSLQNAMEEYLARNMYLLENDMEYAVHLSGWELLMVDMKTKMSKALGADETLDVDLKKLRGPSWLPHGEANLVLMIDPFNRTNDSNRTNNLCILPMDLESFGDRETSHCEVVPDVETEGINALLLSIDNKQVAGYMYEGGPGRGGIVVATPEEVKEKYMEYSRARDHMARLLALEVCPSQSDSNMTGASDSFLNKAKLVLKTLVKEMNSLELNEPEVKDAHETVLQIVRLVDNLTDLIMEEDGVLRRIFLEWAASLIENVYLPSVMMSCHNEMGQNCNDLDDGMSSTHETCYPTDGIHFLDDENDSHMHNDEGTSYEGISSLETEDCIVRCNDASRSGPCYRKCKDLEFSKLYLDKGQNTHFKGDIKHAQNGNMEAMWIPSSPESEESDAQIGERSSKIYDREQDQSLGGAGDEQNQSPFKGIGRIITKARTDGDDDSENRATGGHPSSENGSEISNEENDMVFEEDERNNPSYKLRMRIKHLVDKITEKLRSDTHPQDIQELSFLPMSVRMSIKELFIKITDENSKFSVLMGVFENLEKYIKEIGVEVNMMQQIEKLQELKNNNSMKAMVNLTLKYINITMKHREGVSDFIQAVKRLDLKMLCSMMKKPGPDPTKEMYCLRMAQKDVMVMSRRVKLPQQKEFFTDPMKTFSKSLKQSWGYPVYWIIENEEVHCGMQSPLTGFYVWDKVAVCSCTRDSANWKSGKGHSDGGFKGNKEGVGKRSGESDGEYEGGKESDGGYDVAFKLRNFESDTKAAVTMYQNHPGTSMMNKDLRLDQSLRLSSTMLKNHQRKDVEDHRFESGQVVVFSKQHEQHASVCDDQDWGIEEANVVCSTLYGSDPDYVLWKGIPQSISQNDPSVPDVLLDKLGCSGAETDLLLCTHRWGKDNCKVKELAGVSCELLRRESTLTNTNYPK
ncbi:uncharacterized protein [Panulirus ornatus]